MRSFGRFEIAAVDAGRYRLDGGTLFGVVPKKLWQQWFEPDESNRIELALRLLVVSYEQGREKRRILIDTGIGDKLPAKRRGHVQLVQPPGGLEAALQRAGVPPREITDVILTHLHFDHAGGATRQGEPGGTRPTFEQATYHVQKRAWKWAQHPTERDRVAFSDADCSALASRGRLHLLDGPTELFPGLSLILSEGHTVAMQLPLIDGDRDGKLLFCSDVIPTRAHVRLPWIMAYDLYPLTTLEEKRLLLAQGLEEGWTLFYEHDPDVAACRIAEEECEIVCGGEVAV